MKIMLVQDAEWRKKGPHHQHHLMELLSLRDHEVLVIGFDQLWKEDASGLYSPREEVHNVCRFYKNAKVTFIRPWFIKFPLLDYITFLLSSYSEINRQIKSFKPDIIIGFSSILSNYWGMALARKYRIPFMYYWVDIVHKLSVPQPFCIFALLLEKMIVKNSSAVVVINKALRDYIINFGADPSITHVITGGIDFDRFNFSEYDAFTTREHFNIGKDDTVLFFMGWLYEFSGLKEVIIELNRLRAIIPNVKLVIVGEGPSYLELKRLVEKISMDDMVILTGKRPYDEIPKLVSMADICLLPAYNNEIMKHIVPIKLYEYLAMNKPIISTNLPGLIKEFGHNSGIIYVDKPEDVIKKVTNLTSNDLISESKKAGEFIKDYKWDKIVDVFESLLLNVIKSESK